MPNWKKLIVSGSNAVLNSVTASNGFLGTSSWASQAVTASTINTTNTNSNIIYYPTFVTSNINTVASTLYTDSNNTIRFNPGLGYIYANQFIGLATNASTASKVVTIRSSDTKTNYLTFVDSNNTPEDAEIVYTTSGITVVPSIASISATSFTGSLDGTAASASYTPNALITASVSSNVLTFTKGNGTTFNLTVNTGSGGGGSTSPSGPTGSIQFNGNGVFSGSANFKYQYDLAATDAGRITHVSSTDYGGNAYDEHNKNSLRITNDPNDRRQYAGIVNMCERLPANTGATTIFTFKAGGAFGGGNSIKVLGFKCDYSLGLDTGTYMGGSRVGTLWGAWDYDTGQNPSMTETTIAGDTSFNELTNSVFTLIRNGSNVELQLDVNAVNYNVYYNLLITVFTQTAI